MIQISICFIYIQTVFILCGNRNRPHFHKYKNKIRKLEQENTHLHKVVDKFYETVDKFISWICNKFGIGESKQLVKHFENDTNSFIDPVKQLKHEEREKEWDLEM